MKELRDWARRRTRLASVDTKTVCFFADRPPGQLCASAADREAAHSISAAGVSGSTFTVR